MAIRKSLLILIAASGLTTWVTATLGQPGGDRRPRMGSQKSAPPSALPEDDEVVPAEQPKAPPSAPKSPPPRIVPAAPAEQMQQAPTPSSPPVQAPVVTHSTVVRSSPPPVASSPPPASKPPASIPQTGVGRAESYYPSGDRNTSAVLLERSVPAEVRVGDPYDYEIKLTNLTGKEIQALELTEQIPSGFTLSGTTPSGSTGDGSTQWSLGTLAPRQSTSVRVSGKAEQTGELRYCATVTFKTELCGTNRIVQPALELTMTATPEVILCDPITLKFVVVNSGTGVARNVKVTGALPSGWSSADGRSSLTFDAGDLGERQSREFSATVKATATGRFTSTGKATEDGGLNADASADTSVIVPKLVLTKTGPNTRYLGRPAKYEITLRNEGDGPAKDTVLTDDIGGGTTILETSPGSQSAGGHMTWNLGTIEPGGSRNVSMTVTPKQIGTIQNNVTAKAYCADASASASTQVLGIPAILLEVVDNDDPIEVNANETYDIIVTNQGSADDTNIVITCTLPDQQDYISGTGPTPPSVEGKVIRFGPLGVLAPKAKAMWKIVVRGTGAGDVRFHASMNSDQLKTPVEETESTHIYE